MRRFLHLPLVGAALLCAPAAAQEPILADSATQPSPGHAVIKHQFRYVSMSLSPSGRGNNRDIDDYGLWNTVNVGLRRDVSLSLRVPVIYRRDTPHAGGGADDVMGVGDATVLAKWRIWQADSSPLDTARLSLLGGAEIRTGDDPFTNDAYNPVIGLAYTQVFGRHGINVNPSWTFTTGGASDPTYAGMSTADLLRYNLAYLYRLFPAEYSADTHGALYATVELNGTYETNGDNELLISPGLMYEASRFALELAVQAPLWQDVAHRADTRYAIVAGVRWTF